VTLILLTCLIGDLGRMAKGLWKAAAYAVSALLFFLGAVFMISVNLGIIYFFEGLVFISIAMLLLILSREKKPIEIKQTISIGGPVKVKEIRCPICGATIDATKVKVVAGKPVVTCNYCGNSFELTEEPLW
jgi:predicted membrane protein